MGGPIEIKGPDLAKGVPLASLGDGMTLLGHVGAEPVLVLRRGGELLAIGAICTHYDSPLADGIIVGDTVHCPTHHACFDLRTGEATAPAFKPVASWNVEQRGESFFVTSKRPALKRAPASGPALPKSVVIVGGGAAGHASAESLRSEGYTGEITMISADTSAPYDRTNVSKDYLAGTAPEEWMPMRPAKFYTGENIQLKLGQRVTAIDVAARRVVLENGDVIAFDALILATGADPVRLSIPGHDLPHVAYVRTLADSRAIIARLGQTRRALVLGASFIGLEAAASLRARNIEVHVAAPSRPLERVLGPELGDFVRGLHEEHGVVFHIGPTATEITHKETMLSDGTSLQADLVVVGIGVKPSLALAEQSGLKIDRGVSVNEFLETNVPGIYAVGDIARWPDEHSGVNMRVEHWVVAQRQGQRAARNILGRRERFSMIPFFWSQHYDVAINYVGHAERWDRIDLRGSLKGRNCIVAYRDGERIAAVATIGRDRASLEAEDAMARNDSAALEAIVAG
jgi:NADPH-dependent 2,4-dienoyl-CoA reductase/sulfur reductase-like enzyme/nitrite reductase/ring-hydroxylating ferredoxin subunit